MYRIRLLITGLLLLAGFAHADDQGALRFAERIHAVSTLEFTIESAERTLPVTVWYPAQADADAPLTIYRDGIIVIEGTAQDGLAIIESDVAYPLVIFSHGSGGFRYQSLWLVEHLAAQGFIVMAANHTNNTVTDAVLRGDLFSENLAPSYTYRPLDVLAQIALADELNAAHPILTGRIDTDHIAVIGHSFGGYTAFVAGGARLNFDQLDDYCASADEGDNVCFILDQRDQIAAIAGIDDTSGTWPPLGDERVRAVIALSPWNAPVLDVQTLNASTVAHLIIVGSADPTTPPERDAFQHYAALESARRTLVTFAEAGHYLFVDECFDLAIQMGFTAQCSDPVWDMPQAHTISNHIITAFLRDVLYDDTEARAALDPDTIDFDGVDYQSNRPEVALERLTTQVIARYPHDPTAFTQGLLLHNGVFYESTGNYGASTLRRVAIETGEVLQQIDLSPQFFGEGLALVDERLIQITWMEGVAFVYERETFDLVDTFDYEGQGWGLCYDGEHLYMSDGSDAIFQRDAQTFELLRSISVTQEGQPRQRINELACVGDSVYANVWYSDDIIRIRKADGVITAVIDASTLLTPDERIGADVLNGIAYDETTGLFYVTGKYWPYMFLVDFVPQNQDG